ncbi:hypothetical protein [Pseudomonas sp.]
MCQKCAALPIAVILALMAMALHRALLSEPAASLQLTSADDPRASAS